MKHNYKKLTNFRGKFDMFTTLLRLDYSIYFSIVGIIIAFISVFIKDSDNYILVTLGCITAFSGFLSIVINIIHRAKIQKHFVFQKIDLTDPELFEKLTKNKNYQYIINGQSILMYKKETNELIKNHILETECQLKGKYEMPEDCKVFFYGLFKKRFNEGKHLFNDKKIKLNTDFLLLEEGEKLPIISLSKTNYFNSICTNELNTTIVSSTRKISYSFNGLDMLLDKKGNLYPLEKSFNSNHIGVSSLILTKDHKYIISRQGALNQINTNKYITSGSGSLDLADYRKNISFNDLIVKGMNREIREECNIPQNIKINTSIIGYARLIDRGAKPEFFGISYIDISSKEFIEIANKGKEIKQGYVDRDFIAIDSINQIDNLTGNCTTQLLYYKQLI